MLNLPLDDDMLFDAFLRRDASFEGRALVAVKTTGIFCRLTCPARKPKRQNAVFFQTAAECMEAGFRPCKRCKPLSRETTDPVVSTLMAALEAEPSKKWSEADLIAMGFDPSTVRRAFRRQLGTTFLEMARLTRLRMGAAARSEGTKVIDAQLEAGFESASGFRAAFSDLMGRAPGMMPENAPLAADFISTPIGPMVAVGDDETVWLLEFADRKELPRELRAVESDAGAAIGFGKSHAVDELKSELRTYFAGEACGFSTKIAPYGTEFMRQVHAGLRQIPSGETRSYGQLAGTLGRPTAMRAVARANAANRLAVIVPCHRVIAADGKLAGYAGGVWRKQWLLEHEAKMRDAGIA